MPPIAATAVGVAIILDLLFGEPPERIHPVAVYGRFVAGVDRAWGRSRFVGVLVVLSTIAVAVLVAGLTAIAGHLDPIAGLAVAALTLFTTTSLRLLLDTAHEVVTASATDIDAARHELRALAGRDADTLSPAAVRSAAVESAAENLADGLVGPLLAFALFSWSLPLAAGAAAWVKAVNTTDSMLGYPAQPIGWAPARLDDAVMWLPARLTAVLIALAAFDPGAVRRGGQWTAVPASPNSGWPMATLAATLGVRLEKPGAYVIGSGQLPATETAHRGISIVGRAAVIAFFAAGVIAWS